MNRERLYNIFLHASLVVLLLLVVMLAIENQSLKSGRPTLPFDAVEIGDTLEMGGLQHVVGTPPPVEFTRGRIVYVLSTSCPYCKQNIPLWNDLATSKRRFTRAIAICLSSDSAAHEFLKDYPVQFPMFVPADIQDFRIRNRVYGVPRTLYVDKDDVIRGMWVGLLSKALLSEIESQIP